MNARNLLVLIGAAALAVSACYGLLSEHDIAAGEQGTGLDPVG